MGTHPGVALRVLTLALFGLAACSEGASPPSAPELMPLATAIHDELPPPTLTGTVIGDDVLLEWTWSDTEDWAFVTFSLYEEGVRVLDAGKVRPYTAGYVYTASWTDYNVEAGTHIYCLKAMANGEHVKKTPKITSHSQECETVVVP